MTDKTRLRPGGGQSPTHHTRLTHTRTTNRTQQEESTISSINDFVVAEGDEARQINEATQEQRTKANYIRLKDGESVRGYLIAEVAGADDKFTPNFKSYYQHGDWTRKIHSHACLDPKHGQDCLSCQQGISRTLVTIVPFWDIDAKETRVFEFKKGNMRSVYSFIDLYGEDAANTRIYVKRVGSGKETKYDIIAAPPAKPAEKALWTKPADIALDDAFYLGVINPPTDAYLRKLLGMDAANGVNVKAITDDGEIVGDDLPF